MTHDLQWLLGDTSLDEFFDRNFEKDLLHVNGRSRNYYEAVFAPADLDKIVAQSPEFVRQHMKHFRETHVGANENTTARSDPPDGSAASLRAAHERGYTLVLRDMFRAWLPVAHLTREIQSVFFARLEVHLFVTPAGAQGLPAHYDSDDSFVLQISGSKHWRIFHNEVALPMGPQGKLVDAARLGAPCRQLTMQAGDLLYVPRGLVHVASTSEAPSMHLTFGVFPYRWHEVLCDLICSLAERDVSLRRSVPRTLLRAGALGAAAKRSEAGAQIASLLRSCVANAALTEPIETHIRQFIDDLPMLEPGLFQSTPERTNHAQIYVKRAGMICCVYEADGKVVLKFPGGAISGPAAIRSAFEFVAEARGPFRTADLPGELSQNSRSVLIRRLLHEGLLELQSTPSCPGNQTNN